MAVDRSMRSRRSDVAHGAAKFLQSPGKGGLILAVVGVLLYLNTVGHDYALDDFPTIVDNPFVQQGIRGVPGLLTVDTWSFANLNLGYYRPLSLVTFAIEQQCFGGNPGVSHAINALFYGLIVWGAYVLLARLFAAKGGLAFLAALVFASHPIHTEVVANIKGRDELLSSLGVIAALLLLLKHLESKKALPLALSLIAAYLGFLSKETAFVVVLLAPLTAFYSAGQSPGKCVKWAFPYAGAAALFLWQKYALMHSLSGAVPDDILNYPYAKSGVQLPASFLVFAMSARLLFFPHPLRYDYSYNYLPCQGWSDPGVIVGLALFLLGLAWAARALARRSAWGFGGSFFFVAVVPALMFVFLRGGIMAERFLFLPSLGFALVAAAGLTWLGGFLVQRGRAGSIGADLSFRAAMILTVLLCGGYSIRTFARNADWRNNATLFTADIKTGRTSAQNLRHFAGVLTYQASISSDGAEQQRYSKRAIEALEEALRIHPGFGEAYCKLGVNYQVFQTNLSAAIQCYEKAIEVGPGFAESYFHLGQIYEGLGKSNVASYYYNKTLELNPREAEAGRRATELRAAGFDIHLNPLTVEGETGPANANDPDYYFRLGNQQAAQGNYEKAIEHYRRAISLNPQYESAYVNLANCLSLAGQLDSAIQVLNQVLAINPNQVSALKNLSIYYKNAGDEEKGREFARKAEEARRRR